MRTEEMINKSENAAEINEGIRALDYRPEEVTAFKGETISSFIPKAGKKNGDKFIVVTKKKHCISGQYDIAVPNARKDITYPGALLVGNQKVVEGVPDPLVLKKRPMCLTIDLPGLTDDNHIIVSQNDYAGVTQGINKLLDNWLTNKSGQYVIPANMQYKKNILYDKKSMALSFGCDVEYMQGKLGIDFGLITEQERSAYLIQFRQIYYTVSAELPQSPADVFADEVTWNDLKYKVNNENPPCYVQNVQYGREVYLLLQSDLSSSELKAHLDANLKIEDGSVSANVDAKSKDINKNINCTIITIGGKPVMINGNLANDNIIEKVNDLISENVVLSAENPAFPLAYTVAFLKDNKIASIQGNTEYITSESVEYNSGNLELRYSGAYVARFEVSWEEVNYDKNGNEVVTTQNWSDNGKHVTAGYSTTILFPGNVRNIHVKAQGTTGLVWEPWRTSLDQRFDLVDKRTISISGTTLNQKSNVNP